MSKETNGWAGSNPSSQVWCNLCLKHFEKGEMMGYHGPEGIHLALCSECADKIGEGFYGCGCGG
jgi:hypothetical protein